MKYIIIGMVFIFGCIGCSDSTKQIGNESNIVTIGQVDLKMYADFLGEYQLYDTLFGAQTKMELKGDFRILKTNGLPNHATGTFPNDHNPNTISVQNNTYKFPMNPKFTGEPKMVKEPGVALNGIKFDPGTAEVVICENDEYYRVEAIQDFVNLGLDDNNAHVQPFGAYHYHGVSEKLVNIFYRGKDLVHIGFAMDGFPIYYSKSGAYHSSYKIDSAVRIGLECIYNTPMSTESIEVENTQADGTYTSDWVYHEGIGDLDECNGIEVNGEYMYLITDEYPFIGRCLMGEFIELRPKGPPPGGHHPPHKRGKGYPPSHIH